jgi:ABC-type branched-subunit amino acid transport system substrate-binding protein
VDAASTHVAEQVAVKARVPLVDAVSTDRTVNAAMVPWMFSCQPADESIAAAVGARVLEESGSAPFTLVSATSHDERMLAREVLRYFAGRKVAPQRHVEFAPGQPPEVDAAAVVLAAGATDGAHIARQLRGARIYGGASFGRRQFLREAGEAADGVRYAALGPAVCGMDYAEAQSRDAACMVAAAIRRAGLSREAVRKALEEISPWQGRGGEVRWNALNRNARPVACAVLGRSNEWESSVIKESETTWN